MIHIFIALMISLTAPQPLADAVSHLSRKTPIGSTLRSADWASMPLALRQRGQFSATVESVRVMAAVQEKLLTSVALMRETVAKGEALVDRSSFIGDMRKMLDDMGYLPQPGKSGSLQDLSSRKRLGLIFDVQTAQAQGYAEWKKGMDPDLLDAAPAQELVRVEHRAAPRDWHARWEKAGGTLIDGRMVALKTDGIWKRISRFGTPYPPFDFQSGMGLDEIFRDEAEQLGLLKSGEELQPTVEDFNAELQASISNLNPVWRDGLQSIFGDQIEIQGHTVAWKGNVISDLVNQAIASKGKVQRTVRLGTATQQTIEASQPGVPDLTGYKFILEAGRAYHAWENHGPEGLKLQDKDDPLSILDFELLPEIWRNPMRIVHGGKTNTIVIEGDILGRQLAAGFLISKQDRVVRLSSFRKEKAAPAAKQRSGAASEEI